jgi:putative addiction module component (TIGR02574 family)
MNRPIKTLMLEARNLSADERAAMIDDLLISLQGSDADWNAAWAAQVDRRWSELQSGKIEGFDADETLAEIQARLVRRRQK